MINQILKTNDNIIKDGEAYLIEHVFNDKQANSYFETLLNETPWRQDKITVYGKLFNVPRLQQWYGDKKYTWSGLILEPLPWTPILIEIKKELELLTKANYNTVLLNLYRNGNDTVGWHADNEPELGKEPTIASLNFGVSRDFILRHNQQKFEDIKLTLNHNSLLLMKGRTQQQWKHSLPRRKKITTPRINLTFRNICPLIKS